MNQFVEFQKVWKFTFLTLFSCVGIEYGAGAYFIFEKSVSKNADITKIHGNMRFLIDQLPTITKMTGRGKVGYNNTSRGDVTDIKVKFH